MLVIEQASAIRAKLRQQGKLKLAIPKRIGKAYTAEEKQQLIQASSTDRRSKGIHLAIMLAQNAGLRDKEIRTLRWFRFDLAKRILTVGESKTDAGTGRTIPMNDDLFAAAHSYSDWYTGRFGERRPEWFVFPFGRTHAMDPKKPQTTIKTAWRNTRRKAGVHGRFHDNRHTFVTDLAESGAGDQVIQDLAGHVSRDMVKHYSDVRTEAKRRAVQALCSPSQK